MAGTNHLSSELAGLAGTFSGGLGGAPTSLRSSQRSKVRAVEFSYVQVGAGAIGDTLVIAQLFPTDRIEDYMYTTTGANTGVTLAMGLYDTNKHSGLGIGNGGLVDSTIDPAQSVATAGVVRPSATNVVRAAVGTDPAGDETVNQTPPTYGSGVVQVVLTAAGAGLVAGATVNGYLLVDVGN